MAKVNAKAVDVDKLPEGVELFWEFKALHEDE